MKSNAAYGSQDQGVKGRSQITEGHPQAADKRNRFDAGRMLLVFATVALAGPAIGSAQTISPRTLQFSNTIDNGGNWSTSYSGFTDSSVSSFYWTQDADSPSSSYVYGWGPGVGQQYSSLQNYQFWNGSGWVPYPSGFLTDGTNAYSDSGVLVNVSAWINPGSLMEVANSTPPNGTNAMYWYPISSPHHYAVGISFNPTPLTFTYNGNSQGPVLNPNPSNGTYTISGVLTAAAVGSYSFTATGSGSYSGNSGLVSWTINPEPVTFNFSGTSFTYNSAAQGPSISTNPSGATFTPGGTTSATNAGSYSVSARVNGNYSGSGSTSWAINPEPVTFSVSPTSFTYNGGAQGPAITPSPGGATYSTSGTPSATAAGSYSISATANGNYTGTSGAITWTIAKATPVITWRTPAAINYGTALSATQLNATANVPGTFVYTPAAGAVLGAGTQTLSVTFIPTDGTDYNTATKTVSLVVNAASATFTIAPTSFTYNGGAQGPTITPSPAGATFGTSGTVRATATGSYSVTATANGTYSGTSGVTPWMIAKATPVITWATPAAIAYGTPLSVTQLDATANVPGTFVYSPTAGAVLNAGAQTLSVTFTPTDGTDYNTVAQTVSLTVNPVGQTVTVTPVSQTVPLGQAANFTASGSSTGYTWIGATGNGASATQTWGAVGTYTVTVQAPASGNYAASNTATATVTVTLKQQTVTITPSAPTLTAGQSVTLTASGGQNGYTWGGVISGSGSTQSPSFPNVGTYTVTVLSAAGNNYAQSNTASAVITVNAAGQTVSITPTNPTVQAGQSLTFTASGGFTPYVWGGQATGTGSIQTPIFGSVGMYPVTVYAQAQGNYAQSNTATALVTTTTIPQTITVTPSQTTIYVNASVTLIAAGGNTSYSWGGAASGAGATQNLSWPTPGTYTVTVQAPASGNYAASNTATATITVKTAAPGIKNNSDTGTVSIQGAEATDPNAILPPSH